MVGPSEEAAGALLYGGDGRIRKEFLFDACDFEVVQELSLHILAGDVGQMASGHTPGEARGREILYMRKSARLFWPARMIGKIGL
ncbi:hypothetical protein DFAR_1250001 [Desulfarculales bacterium]